MALDIADERSAAYWQAAESLEKALNSQENRRRYFYWHCDCNCCSCKYQTDLEGHAGAVLMPNRYSGAASWSYRQHPKQVTPGNRVMNLSDENMISHSMPGTLNSCHLTVKGLSEPPYTPEEFASIEDMEDGVEVLALTLVQQSLY
ncbi:unnamed protein product [Camellia sinensis]